MILQYLKLRAYNLYFREPQKKTEATASGKHSTPVRAEITDTEAKSPKNLQVFTSHEIRSY